MDIKDLIIYSKTIPRREAKLVDFPGTLSKELSGYLVKKGISKLYCHQAEMFERASEKNNIVITTSTASGKTRVFDSSISTEVAQSLE